MDLSTTGERATIASLTELVREAQGAGEGDLLDMEDDCAVIPFGDLWLVMSTDSVNATTHFPFGTPMELAGWYAAAVNISDLAAMGAEPLGMLLALGLPSSTGPSDVSELYGGAVRCASRYGVAVVGGDTKQNPVLTICGTAGGA